MHFNVTTKHSVCTLLLLLLLHLSVVGTAQSVPVKGRVVDTDGTPLVGVTVRVKDTNTGTVTGADGTYTLTVPGSTAVLAITYLGYDPQEIAVGTQTEINVTLKVSSSQLEQVVVVGYGTQRKKT
ncbi:carboxypeptidase-like regulatory domain-containing protein [Chitinophaga sedimenti]|uniref:carboxypeptidase-like regulatory domain-containing protein n=1 Tax=Chitinophaga sedimenti TaxID=2033606 RepID=UPI0020057A63|nr:carboxypeptidase-like regulatory domain-containing protein [Chitinophaga sedimenti]MCK7557444.1 carboxypeptidase-like regulatory domain-containing protein [Chitinophaga sedimenti]